MPVSIAQILSTTHLFGTLDPKDLERLESEFEWVRLAGGETLFEEGEAGDCLYVVVSGRLEVVVTAADGTATVIGEAGAGDVLGEMAVVTGEERSATIRSLRDSAFLRLAADDFNKLLEGNYRLMREITCRIVEHYKRLLDGRATPHGSRVSTIAVATTQRDRSVAEFTRRLVAALGRHGTVLHLDSAAIDTSLGAGWAETARDGARNATLVPWLNEQEQNHRFVVYEADGGPSPWTSRCLRQADRILLVAHEAGDQAPGPIENAIAMQGLGEVRPADLVLLHAERRALYPGTSAWLAPRRVRHHHHLVDGNDADIERLVRMLTGRVVGLVLGGGGARSFAQIGVLRALEEHGVQIDMVGGASMGAFLGAQIAMGWDAAKLLLFNEVTWTRTKPLKDYTFPYMALVTGRRFFEVARAAYGDAEFEDLRIPFFCCSSNLTKATVKVHRSGPIWRSLGASIAVPGLAPPAFENGDLLVDGAVLDNLPVDVMRAQCLGTVIAIDVSPVEDLAVDAALTIAPNAWGLLFGRLLGRKSRIPTIFELLGRSAGLGSVQQIEAMKRLSSVFLHPPIESYSIFDFAKIRVLEAAGYAYAKEALPDLLAAALPKAVPEPEEMDAAAS